MGGLSAAAVSTSQFPALSNSLRNNVPITVSPTAAIKSSFVGSCCNLRQHRLTRLSSYLTLSSRSKLRHVCKSQLAVQDFAPVASAGYAVLLLGGGLFAYNKSGSKGSLFGGLTGAVLMSAAYYLMQSPETKELGDALAFGASLLFALVFGIRFAATVCCKLSTLMSVVRATMLMVPLNGIGT
ncbi:protein fatty acid export 4, chloroplastic [Tanacetum coccineum]|uniref:Protein fatty acid export 4, chloroplastic n=1 Tax=Tanacetum coccineum TaxID=301880 RepID=A0ABQ5IU07_9ASTR